jgi:hypothetical protein
MTSQREPTAALAAASLFSDGPRTERGPKGHAESEYAFLNDSARGACARARELLDTWYGQLPPEAQASIRSRFKLADVAQHRGAVWELYLHETFRRLEYAIELDIGKENPEKLHPDFLLTGVGDFYLEATAALGASVLGDSAANKLAAACRDLIEEVNAPNFSIGVDLEACGPGSAPRREVIDPLERWLDPLDPDEVLAAQAAGEELPTITLSFAGWNIVCTAIPVGPNHRDDPGHRVLGTYSEGFSVIDDAKPLRRKLKRKAGRYGEMELPYVIAVLCAGDFADDKDIADALFGSVSLRFDIRTGRATPVREPDALWIGPKGPQNTRVSAVLTIPQLSWSAIAAVEPTVWLNPWAARPLTAELPWRTKAIAPDGSMGTREPRVTPAALFEISPRWPSE